MKQTAEQIHLKAFQEEYLARPCNTCIIYRLYPDDGCKNPCEQFETYINTTKRNRAMMLAGKVEFRFRNKS